MTDYSKYANHEIDRMVAERIMGWKKEVGPWHRYSGKKGDGFFFPTTNANDMMLLVEKMIKDKSFQVFELAYNIDKGVIFDHDWRALFWKGPGEQLITGSADTPNRAVCEAALKMVEKEVK